MESANCFINYVYLVVWPMQFLEIPTTFFWNFYLLKNFEATYLLHESKHDLSSSSLSNEEWNC